MRRATGEHRLRHRRGVTFAEVAISTLLIGLLVVSALKCSAGVIQNWSVASDEYRMAHLADLLLAEVVSNLYEEPDEGAVFGLEAGEAGGTRSLWDDTDDFHGWTSSPPQSSDGSALSEYSGWTRAVSVRLAGVADPLATPGSDEGLKLIEVAVTAPNGETLVRRALRSRWGQVDQPVIADATWITSVTTSLTLTDGATSTTGSGLPNSVEDAL